MVDEKIKHFFGSLSENVGIFGRFLRFILVLGIGFALESENSPLSSIFLFSFLFSLNFYYVLRGNRPMFDVFFFFFFE